MTRKLVQGKKANGAIVGLVDVWGVSKADMVYLFGAHGADFGGYFEVVVVENGKREVVERLLGEGAARARWDMEVCNRMGGQAA